MTVLPNIGITLPTRGAPGAGLWDDTQDSNSALIDAHNHQTGKGLPITSAAISVDADISFASAWAPTNLHRIQFASVTALAANNKSLFVNTSDNELYWRSNAGSNVKLTSGSALNVAAFTGGIGGDYASVGAAVAFDDAGDRYTFKQQSGTWARMASGAVRIFETGSTDSVFVGLEAPAALAVSYTITFPLAPPAASSIMRMSSAGVVSTEASVTKTFNVSLAVPGVGVTYSAGSPNTSCPSLALGTTTTFTTLPVTVSIGDTITAWSIAASKSSAAGTISAELYEARHSDGTSVRIGAGQTNSANNPGVISLGQSGLSTAVVSGKSYYAIISGGGTTGDVVFGYSATVTT